MMNTRLLILAVGLLAAPVLHAGPRVVEPGRTQSSLPTEADRRVIAGRILLKWGGYVEKVNGEDKRAWSASLWPSLKEADLGNLQKAYRAVTYEGMRNALLGQRPYDDQVVDRLARAKSASPKALGSLTEDLVFTPITPCRIADTRVLANPITAGAVRPLDASNAGGNFTSQGGSSTDCGIPANPAALALSVTANKNTGIGYVRVFPYDGTTGRGSTVPLPTLNTNVTNDLLVPACQACTQELRITSTADTQYIVDAVGYFTAPEAAALDCTVIEETGSLGLLSGLQPKSVACPAGYAATGGGCGGPLGITVSNSGPVQTNGDPTGWQCDMVGSLLSIISYKISATCCRTPGR